MDINKIFNPLTVVVVGASNNKKKVGYAVFSNLLQGGKRNVIPVNINQGSVLGVPALKSVSDVTEAVDLVVIATPAHTVPSILRICGEKKISFVIVISAGFKEADNAGRLLEEEIKKIAQENNIFLLGPNCLGIIDTHTGLNATFGVDMPKKGSVAFISQSGAIGTALLDWANQEDIGISKFISLGNKAAISELHFLLTLIDDKETKAILLYLEGVDNGRAFLQILKKLTPKKPVVVLKAGRSDKGGEAVKSHTGSLAPESRVFEAVCWQHGAATVNTLQEFFDAAKLFSSGVLKPPEKVAVVTNAGGPSVVTTDLIQFSKSLTIVDLPDDIKYKLRGVLPPMASVGNPVDILGDAPATRYNDVLNILSSYDGIDSIFVLLTPQMMTEPEGTAEILASFKDKKIIVPIFMGGDMVKKGIDILRKNGITYFKYPQTAISLFDALSFRKKVERHEISEDESDLVMSSFEETSGLLKNYGMNFLGTLVKTKEDLYSLGDKPQALKIMSSDIVHKTDAGGIKLNISGSTALLRAWDEIMKAVAEKNSSAEIEGILAQPMIAGKEVIIGMKRDPAFGPIIIFGLGGIFVEVFKDISMRALPLDIEEAKKMIGDIKGIKILKGMRGEAPVNTDALAELMVRVARLAEENEDIQEIDLNPVVVDEKGALIVDARFMKNKA